MEVLKYVCELAGLKYKIEDRAVLVGTEGIDDMEHGFFQVRNSLINRIAAEVGPKEEKEEEKTGGIKDRVDTFTDEGAFDEASTELKSVAPVTPEMLKQFFTDRGISFEDPNSSIAFDTKTNKLIVKNNNTQIPHKEIPSNKSCTIPLTSIDIEFKFSPLFILKNS